MFLGAILALMGACGTGADQDAALRQDPSAKSVLKKADEAASRSVAMSNEDFSSLKALREKYPESQIARKYLITAMLLRSDLTSAERLILEKGDASLSDGDRRLLAKVYVEMGSYRKAIEQLEPLASSNPSDVEIRSLAGISYLRLGDLNSAAESFDAVWDQILQKKMAPEISLRGIIYFRNNEFQKARDTLLKAAEIDPSHITTNNTLSQVYQALGETEKAEEYKEKVLFSQEEKAAKTITASKLVERKLSVELAWKEKRYQDVIRLVKELMPAAAEREKGVLREYLYQSYKKLGMEEEAAKIKSEGRLNSK